MPLPYRQGNQGLEDSHKADECCPHPGCDIPPSLSRLGHPTWVLLCEEGRCGAWTADGVRPPSHEPWSSGEGSRQSLKPVFYTYSHGLQASPKI